MPPLFLCRFIPHYDIHINNILITFFIVELNRFAEVVKVYQQIALNFQLMIITSAKKSVNINQAMNRGHNHINLIASNVPVIHNIDIVRTLYDNKNNIALIGHKENMAQMSEYFLYKFIKQLAEKLLKNEDPNNDCHQILEIETIKKELENYDFNSFVKIENIIIEINKNQYLEKLIAFEGWWVKDGFYNVITDFETEYVSENNFKKFFKYDT